MAESHLGYQDPPGITAWLRGKLLGTFSGKPVVAEYMQLVGGEKLLYGQKAVPTGTAEPLAASPTPVDGLVITAHAFNRDPIVFGDASVSLINGVRLFPGTEKRIPIDDVNKVWVLAGASGHSVDWYGTRNDP